VVSTQTEDGHRFTAFGVTRQQAIYRAHQKAKAYGRYAYPTTAAHERRDGSGEPEPSPEDTVITPWLAETNGWLGLDALDHLIVSEGVDCVRPMTCPHRGETTWPPSW
jgi:RadC-like JAB domain